MFLIGIHSYPATISPGGSLSGPVAMGVDTLVGISMPPAWTAAQLTFQVSPDGGITWQELFGTDSPISVAAGQYIAIDPAAWRGINLLQVRSGTASVPVVQTGGAVVTLIGRPGIL